MTECYDKNCIFHEKTEPFGFCEEGHKPCPHYLKDVEKMTVKELIEELKKHDPNEEVSVFAGGDGFPIYSVVDLRKEFNINRIEINCGWETIDE